MTSPPGCSRAPMSARAWRRSLEELSWSLWARIVCSSPAIDWLSCASRSILRALGHRRRPCPLGRGRRAARCTATVGHDERQHPPQLPGQRGEGEHRRQQRRERPVIEQPAVGDPVAAGHVGKAGHVRPERDARYPADLGTYRHVGRLEHFRERRAAAGGQGQGGQGGHVTGVWRQILLVEREQPVVVHVGDDRAVVVGEPARFPGIIVVVMNTVVSTGCAGDAAGASRGSRGRPR